MSPNPRREKGLSHRASGEEFSRGTFRTIGSLERKRHNPYEKLSSLHTDTRTCSCCTGPKLWFNCRNKIRQAATCIRNSFIFGSTGCNGCIKRAKTWETL